MTSYTEGVLYLQWKMKDLLPKASRVKLSWGSRHKDTTKANIHKSNSIPISLSLYFIFSPN